MRVPVTHALISRVYSIFINYSHAKIPSHSLILYIMNILKVAKYTLDRSIHFRIFFTFSSNQIQIHMKTLAQPFD